MSILGLAHHTGIGCQLRPWLHRRRGGLALIRRLLQTPQPLLGFPVCTMVSPAGLEEYHSWFLLKCLGRYQPSLLGPIAFWGNR